MQVLILAAGYATRLYPLTLNQPKPLLPVAGKPMLEHIIDHLATVKGLDEMFIVTNQKFVSHFTDWSEKYRREKTAFQFKIINDGTTSDADKLGAIGDIHLVATQEKVKGDLVVVAGDNLFDSSLAPFVEFAHKIRESVENDGVDDEQEQPQRQDHQWQGEENEKRLDEGIDQNQDQRRPGQILGCIE